MLTRRTLTSSLAAALAGGSATGVAAASFYHAGPASDHFDGERFFNPGGEEPRAVDAFLRWQLSRVSEPWPDEVPSPFASDTPPAEVGGRGLRASFVGHATFLIQTGGLNILTDPVWSERASPSPSSAREGTILRASRSTRCPRSTPSFSPITTTIIWTCRPWRVSGVATVR
jgi:hypothetical protein